MELSAVLATAYLNNFNDRGTKTDLTLESENNLFESVLTLKGFPLLEMNLRANTWSEEQ
jgi:hypothetical protein